MPNAKFAVIGAGIAGASLSYRLAEAVGDGSDIILLEREDSPGYHSTGRSAAVYTETYGPAVIRALTAASRPFFDNPPAGFAAQPLLHPLGIMLVGGEDRRAKAEELYEQCRRLTPSIRFLEGNAISALVPVLRPEWTAVGVYEPDCMSMDVAAIHQGYLRGFKAAGGKIMTHADVLEMARSGNDWVVRTTNGDVTAEVVVNAAGAWADEIAEKAGLPPLGLVPKRRTALVFQAPDGVDTSAWPMINDIDENFYFKPDAGRILASPEEATPMPPCDVQPDEYDIAVTVDRIEKATTMQVRRIDNKWAGLRSFFDDGVPALGFDPRNNGFFWLAGQGGYGITTSDAMARLAAHQILQLKAPSDIIDKGVNPAEISPARLIG
ncbi:MAG: FAD-binding oxidoreductase [Rhodospirillales bacterium]|nr:FAD-binding oxidoreductase [Rhodospirillales bacterium]MBO6786340.1 FAD-binding oxidoreductase [Rhodospirillales bacterium]